ncbi:MAG: peptidoglycan DD-metalloendopeptidase family protein [Gudongella sp.]|nr:peptidoglycan DD-metalloendopeptidase family protein [Gudongella sp.]
MKLKERFKNFGENIKGVNHNNRLRRSLAVVIAVGIVGISYVSYSINDTRTKAVNVFLGEEQIGVVRTQEEAVQAYTELKETLVNTYQMDVSIDKELSFEETNAKDDALTPYGEIKSKIKGSINVAVTGFELVVDDESLGIFKSEEEVDSMLNTIKEPFIVDNERESIITESSFLEKIDIVKQDTNFSELADPEATIESIRQGKDEMRTHIVEVGESYWIIARMYDTHVEDLINANPDQDPQKLKPGDEVKLFVPTPLLTVVTNEDVKYTEETDYEIEVENDDSLYKNQKKIVVKGEKGSSEIVATEIRHNGILFEKNVIEETVIVEPITEKVIQGTKELPKTAAKGSFIVPTSGRLTSPYGMRNGSMHRGIDLANSLGTAVYAADGGKVTFSGYSGSYGYMVEIDHENGYVTRYAHNSKLLVKAGERVYRGQQISNMGSTGRSTGSHLHFEVIVNGTHQNPSRYIY